MQLSPSRCEELLRRSERAVLGTVHPVRGVDAVPVCFSYEASAVAVPIDRVKPKATGPLQRERNLDADPRAVLLCDHWDRRDWSRLWWVRASLERIAGTPELQSRLEAGLREKYPQYRGAQHSGAPFAGMLVFSVTSLSGWTAGSAGDGAPASEPFG